MTNTIVQSVEKWYTENSELLSSASTTLRIRSKNPADVATGKVVIEFENAQVLASVTLWNDRNISVLAVDKGSRTERILDDRALDFTESVPSLLDGYFRQLTGMVPEASD